VERHADELPRRRSHTPHLVVALAVAAASCLLLGWPVPAHAGGNTTTGLLTPNGGGSPTSDGDYVSATAGMDSPYHFFVEVPAGLSRLVIQLFDADIDEGGTNDEDNNRDRERNGNDTTATYSLFDPSGTQRTAFFTVGDTTTPTASDDVWLSIYDVLAGGNDANMLDNFGTAAYNNNNGSVNWATNWVETNDDGSATTGRITISGGMLHIGDNTDANPSIITRTANLTANGFTNAIFSFSFSTSNAAAGDSMFVQVSNNGGTTWTTLDTFTGAFTTAQSRAYNITADIATNTAIRFMRNTGYTTASHTFNVDAVQIKNDSLPAGHWEVRLDQTAGGTAINAMGVRANDGNTTGGGTELNVYADSQVDVGTDPPATGNGSQTRAYVLYPYITSGCSAGENDFDYDSNSVTSGSMKFTSPSTAFSQSFTGTTLSANDVWTRNTITGWTTDQASTDYGIWEGDVSITSYIAAGAQNGNYANLYLSNANAAANPPAANPTTNAFRIYFPNDAGTAPSEPTVDQDVVYVSGPNPPVVGSTTIELISVRVFNPGAQPINFSVTNLVTANVPGGGAVYGGNASVTQGTIVAQPAVGGTGNITWNPGTVAAGTATAAAAAKLYYEVKVTPTVANQRILVTGAAASANGTTAKYVDGTGNTSQLRATYTFGPLCELAVTQAVASPVVVSAPRASAGRGGVLFEWDTHSEVGSTGFDVLRWEPRAGRFVQVNRQPLPALVTAPQGGHYRFLDESARVPTGDEPLHYSVVEHVAAAGRTEDRTYGPFALRLGAPAGDDEQPATGFDRTPRPVAAAGGAGGAAAASGEAAGGAAAEVGGGDLANAVGGGFDAERPEVSKGGPVQALAIGVGSAGIYYVSAASIASQLGLTVPFVQAAIAANGLALSNQASPIAWLPSGDGGGLIFYGTALSSLFSAENVYFLTVAPGIQMQHGTQAPPSSTGSPTATFADTEHTEQDTFAATVVATNPNANYWYWDALIAGDPTQGTKSYTATVNGVGATAATATLQVNLFGATSAGVANDHRVLVTLNGTAVGEADWTGVTAYTASLPVSQSLLHEGANTVQLEAVLNPGVASSIVYLKSFDVSLARQYQAVSNALTVRGGGNSLVSVGGFGGTRMAVFDLTDPKRPVAQNGIAVAQQGSSSSYQVTFAPATAATPYFAVAQMGWKSPTSLRLSSPAPLSSPGQGAAYLVITTHDLLAAAQQLASYRAGQGLTAKVVDVEDIYDLWNNGIADPNAIRNFLAFTVASWQPAPRFVVLAGQGNLDYKNYLGYGGNLLPPLLAPTTYGLFAADQLFADVVHSSGVPSFAIGRLPVGTAAQLQTVVQKIQSYEAAGAAGWSGTALWVADAAQAGANFPQDSDQIATALPGGYTAQRIYVDQVGAAEARTDLLNGIAAGAGLFNYIGHGGLDELSGSGLLEATDVPSLGNGARLPVLTALTCTINRFEVPGITPLGSAMVQQSGGGAVAAWAPSGISDDGDAKVLGQRFYLELGNGQAHGLRLGEMVARALADYAATSSSTDLLYIYQLLGDPALQVKAGPPAALTSTGSPVE
jgi:hypothetical protein